MVSPWFNRTFMELKQNNRNCILDNGQGFNRTFMELKLNMCSTTNTCTVRFNRTFMELKHLFLFVSVVVQRGLIVPLWN